MRRTHRGVMNDISLDPSAFLLLEFLVDDHRRHLVSLLIPQFSPSCSQGSRSQGTYLCRAPDKVFCLDSEGLSQAQRKPAATGFRQPPLPLCTSLTPSADTPSKFLLFLRPDLTTTQTRQGWKHRTNTQARGPGREWAAASSLRGGKWDCLACQPAAGVGRTAASASMTHQVL